jgi:uncharacterized membrane protein
VIEHAGLALATAAFVGTHLALSHPLRTRLVQNVGEAGFTGVYSIVAAATLLWMILAWRAIGVSVPLWIAPDWWWPVASAVMLFASILLVGSFVRNPAFPHPGAAKHAGAAPKGVFAITRHPMNWSVALWALVHLSLWLSPKIVVVTVGMLVLALAGSVGQDRKKRSVMGEPWRRYEARTSFVPFGALLTGKLPWKSAVPSWIALLGGTAFWLAVTWLHAPQVSPLAIMLGASAG